ncbi:hypothetical protein PIB30_014395 [Stylosanthes scabra]|uniref:Pectinesterase n=1 Tax=Stylosanthes scabra TaxID=79078 RepID=A0ABU6U707_9FABA|nr:hypothetical protein [Stylosanthes scabra]
MSLTLCLLILQFATLLASSSSSDSSTDTICNLTPYPTYCKSNAPSNLERGGIHEYGSFYSNKSLSSSMDLLSLVSTYLQSPSKFSHSTILALQDCHLLLDLNIDFWTTTLQTIQHSTNNNNSTLTSSEAENVLTMISAALTNLDTCLDSLNQATSSSPDTDLATSISNGTMYSSISLALFKQGRASSTATPQSRKLLSDAYAWEQRLYEIIRKRGRKLLQSAPDGVVVNQTVVVNPDGSGNYTTITDAVNASPNNTGGTNGFFVIYVVAGVYEEYVSIPKNKQYLMMIGDGINQTIITGNHSAGTNYTTFNSYSFAVVAQGFVAMNITFRNTAGASNYQAVALRSGADLSAFYNCSFEGYQDTLYTHSMRQFYRNCDIYGTVDFIFGNAAVVFQDCNILPRLPMSGQFNTITAQGRTDINQNTGTSIHNCTITAATNLGTTKTYLGRPWKEYSRTVYMQSFMDSLIDPAGWAEWSGTLYLDTLYYAEYNNSGPGSNTTNRVTWSGYHIINATDAQTFTVSNFISGGAWLPATGVPYFLDLI